MWFDGIDNAVVTKVSWDRERGLTHYISVSGDGWGCTFGGWYLGGPACYDWMIALMDVFDIYENMTDEALIGKIIRVRMKDGKIAAIGHPYKNIWLDPKELFAKYRTEEKE